MYYITVYNEPMPQPAEPDDLDVDGLLNGIYLLRSAAVQESHGARIPKAQLLASGVAVPWALDAQRLLADDWNVAADVWSVTSWTQLRREGLAVNHHNFLHPDEPPRVPYLTSRLRDAQGPFVAVTDYMHAVPDQIREFVPGDYATLGADDFGFSDTRAAARRFFKIDAPSLVVRTLEALAARGEIDSRLPQQAIDKYSLHDINAGTTGSTGGES
jgi:pyruvate dehydrogenase E1 component